MGLGPPRDGFWRNFKNNFSGFLVRKKMVSKKTIFFSRKPKKPSFGGPSPIVLEKMVFLVFLVFLVFWIFLVCWFLLVSCFVVFCLDLARTRLPSAVGPLGGGEHIYIYIWYPPPPPPVTYPFSPCLKSPSCTASKLGVQYSVFPRA